MKFFQQVALFLFAHQDDEFGIYQQIIEEQQMGNRVFCAYFTDGNFKGIGSKRRNKESLLVLEQLGIYEKDVFFVGAELGFRDGFLPDYLGSCVKWLSQWLSQFSSISAIYVPAWEGGHQDHDALHAAALIAASSLGIEKKVQQFSLYHGACCFGLFFKVFYPLVENGFIQCSKIPLKRRFLFLKYCMSYPSQAKTWIVLFPFVLKHYLFNGNQLLQTASLKRVLEPPHKGSLLYEKRKRYTWEQMKSSLASLGSKKKSG